MEDLQIIELYNERNETAISETSSKYGRLLYRIANNILSIHEDSEEVVSDTYNKAWDSIPPAKPKILPAYLGRITHNLSINLWHRRTAQKRYSGADLLVSELKDCIPAAETVETAIDTKELAEVIDRWLGTLPSDDRILFLRRYWFCDSVNFLAEECGLAPNKLASRLFRLRQSLKKTLETEGISL